MGNTNNEVKIIHNHINKHQKAFLNNQANQAISDIS